MSKDPVPKTRIGEAVRRLDVNIKRGQVAAATRNSAAIQKLIAERDARKHRKS